MIKSCQKGVVIQYKNKKTKKRAKGQNISEHTQKSKKTKKKKQPNTILTGSVLVQLYPKFEV
jgi:hypothetical protein